MSLAKRVHGYRHTETSSVCASAGVHRSERLQELERMKTLSHIKFSDSGIPIAKSKSVSEITLGLVPWSQYQNGSE
jgi:hypothetical protein